MNWAQRVFEADRRSAEICRDMQIIGFAFDRERAKRIGEQLRISEFECRKRAEDILGHALAPTKGGGFKVSELESAFFQELGAKVVRRDSETGRASLDKQALNAYVLRGGDLSKFALTILEFRRLQKLRTTYVDNIPVQDDGRVRPSWKNYGTVSGRFTCQEPPLQTLPNASKDPTEGVRGLFIPSIGRELVTFDASQFEMRISAYASGDEALMASCAQSDVHAANARLIWPQFDSLPKEGKKKLRGLSKNSGFALAYLAGEETILARILAEGVFVERKEVRHMTSALGKKMKTYYAWQDRRFKLTQITGWTDTPILGRRRFFGFEPEAPEVANFPIQGGAADVMNQKLPQILDRIRAERLEADLVAQVHDSCVFDTKRSHAAAVERICQEVFQEPVLFTTSGRPIEAIFPIEIKREERWS